MFKLNCIAFLALVAALVSLNVAGLAHAGAPARHYAKSVSDAALELIRLTPKSQRSLLLQPFNGPQRTGGRDVSGTPSFCGVLAWCQPYGLPQGKMSGPQLFAMHRLLSLALSSGGYQSLLSVMNRQRVIGEMEAVADTKAVAKVRKEHPKARAKSIFALAGSAGPDVRNWYPSVGGMTRLPNSVLDWSWNPPGAAARLRQFEEYSLLISGTPGKGDWGLRFEGHHLTINLTFSQREDGTAAAFGTPLFLGAFPMIVPPPPSSQADFESEWQWVQGQSLASSAVHHLRQFWMALPEETRKSGLIPASDFQQAPPLLADTPPNYLITSLATEVAPRTIDSHRVVEFAPRKLTDRSRWNLRQTFDVYFSVLHEDLQEQYDRKFEEALKSSAPLRVAWAGGELSDPSTHHYSYVQLGDLLLELFQSNRFSTQHASVPSGNHVHSMLRDLEFDWSMPNPASRHHVSR